MPARLVVVGVAASLDIQFAKSEDKASTSHTMSDSKARCTSSSIIWRDWRRMVSDVVLLHGKSEIVSTAAMRD